ncbi:hypothetical protein LK12_22895 [Novosphingobium malaysiense]|uniref:Alpha/beta hydrolase fold-3 domain-containing protein n=2 Tax=Novosphingobium malaysiense TaxID=1348853 RepID=A0A0B1ZEK4_9SPHN|nr:hypothetical protein LK12_22895 [Novosphingobium malaysiense]
MILGSLALSAAGPAFSSDGPVADASHEAARPTFAADGTVHVPAFDLPPSSLSSKEARENLKYAAQLKQAGSPPKDISQARQGLDELMEPMVHMMTQEYPVNMNEAVIGGVPTRIFTPADKPVRQDRVLINVHGGAFSVCWDSCSKLESIPIAAVGGYKVVSVNYRMAPEHKHPAGLEDLVAVYRELLKSYDPRKIGIYGCSAGGSLTAQAASWLGQNNLPEPAAIGIFGAGGVPFRTGDSAYISAYVDGNFAAPKPNAEGDISDLTFGYFDGANMTSTVLAAAMYPDVLAKFPPALIITGSRAMDMSPAIYTNSMLLKAGRPSTLLVGEALGHCFIYSATLPEARDAFNIISRFFDDNMK